MKNILTFLLSLMTLALLTTTAFPQTITTGSIAGTVTDPSGAAVPEITLTATSPNLIQPQSATTGRDGHYLTTCRRASTGSPLALIEALRNSSKTMSTSTLERHHPVTYSSSWQECERNTMICVFIC